MYEHLFHRLNYILVNVVSEKEARLLRRTDYRRIIVTEKIHGDIKKRAKEANLTIREYIEYLIEKDKAAKEMNSALPK